MKTSIGSCLCGRVTYELAGRPLYMAMCWCTQCQRESGAASLPVIGVKATDFRTTGDLGFLRTYAKGPSTNLLFCSHCGTHLAARKTNGVVHVRVGTLERAPDMAIMAHVHVASRNPALPGPDGREPQFEAEVPVQAMARLMTARAIFNSSEAVVAWPTHLRTGLDTFVKRQGGQGITGLEGTIIDEHTPPTNLFGTPDASASHLPTVEHATFRLTAVQSDSTGLGVWLYVQLLDNSGHLVQEGWAPMQT